MVQTEDQLISEIASYMQKVGGPKSKWYVGIARDPQDRLFSGHGVDREGDAWIYGTASSSVAARRVEDYFLNVVGTDGGPGGGDDRTKSVYAYRQTPTTKRNPDE